MAGLRFTRRLSKRKRYMTCGSAATAAAGLGQRTQIAWATVALEQAPAASSDRPRRACRQLARTGASRRAGRRAAVVKADAYGIGLSEAAPALWAAGARVFFVAHLNEGLAARRRPAGGSADLRAQRPRERGRSSGLCRAWPRARDRRRGRTGALVRLRRAPRPALARALCISTPA